MNTVLPRLFHKEECPFCWKARIALAEAGIDYDLTVLGPDDDRGTLNRHSPSGSTPFLLDGDLAIWESAVIVEYAADRAPTALLPADAGARARARLLHSYSDTQVGRSLREVVFEKRSKPEKAWDRERIAAGEDGWRACLDWLDNELNGRRFFAGVFSVAECALFPRFALADHYGVGVDNRHPALKIWFDALCQRPSCAATLPSGWAVSAEEEPDRF